MKGRRESRPHARTTPFVPETPARIPDVGYAHGKEWPARRIDAAALVVEYEARDMPTPFTAKQREYAFILDAGLA